MRSALEKLQRVPPKARIGAVAALVIVVAIVVLAGGDDNPKVEGKLTKRGLAIPTKNDPSNVGAPRTKLPDVPTLAERRKKKKSKGCGEQATQTCSPHLPVEGSLKNDGLTWSVESVRTLDAVGDPVVRADGTYLAVKVKVSSDRDDSVTLTDLAAALKMGKSNFSTDGEATLAAVGSEQADFLYSDLDGGKSKSGTLLFDIPADRVGQPAELRVNKLGDTDPDKQFGFLRLPAAGA